jgi:hypothetical protein
VRPSGGQGFVSGGASGGGGGGASGASMFFVLNNLRIVLFCNVLSVRVLLGMWHEIHWRRVLFELWQQTLIAINTISGLKKSPQ